MPGRAAMSHCVRSAVIALTLVAVGSQAQGQTVRSQLPVVTRLVQVYSENEQRLADAVNRRDSREIDRLLASDFEFRSAGSIGTPVPRADWLAQALKEPSAAVSIGQMAVHDYGTIRVVSFLMTRTGAPAVAVVDVWMELGDASVLKVRYAAVQAPGSAPVPGDTRQQPIEKRY